MDDKLSKFNIEVEHCSCVLLYNALTNKLLPISFQDYAVIETLMEHLPEFRKRYPKLYHFGTQVLLSLRILMNWHLSNYKIKKRYLPTMITRLRSTRHWIVI